MATKKLLTMEDALKQFKDIMERASLSSYYHVNNVMLSKNDKDNKILVVPDRELWSQIIDDKEMSITEPDPSKEDENELMQWFRYGEETESGWFPIDVDQALFSGKIFKIKMKDLEYQISINRDLMPLKLKKSEYEGVAYHVFTKPLVLAIKKRFDTPKDVEGGGFTIIRLFQVV